MLDETIEFLEERQSFDKDFKYEIIVIDDGSKDQTFKVIIDYVTVLIIRFICK